MSFMATYLIQLLVELGAHYDIATIFTAQRITLCYSFFP
jgi:hypothetical protein